MVNLDLAPHAPPVDAAWLATAKDAFVKVGSGGRGFLIEGTRGRTFVVTATHCLKRLPRMRPWEDTPFPKLLGPLGRRAPTVWAECLFADPISDIAVLSGPDQAWPDAEFDAYLNLTDDRPKLRIGSIKEPCGGWLLGLDREWERCTIRVDPQNRCRGVAVDASWNTTMPGTSGSPILTEAGEVVSLMSMATENPRLALELPVWLVNSCIRERPDDQEPDR